MAHSLLSHTKFLCSFKNTSLNNKQLTNHVQVARAIGPSKKFTKSYKSYVLCRAALSEDDSNVAPLQPESPAGQLLAELLKNHPHLLPAAAEQQLEKLIAEREEAEAREREKAASTSGADLVLYKRIEEVRATERKRAIEEVMYSLIVQRFRETGANMVPKIPFIPLGPMNPLSLVPTLPVSMDKELLAVHSEEARELVVDHLSVILGGKPSAVPDENSVIVQADKVRMGQVYAASIMFGYFLRRVDLRYQLDKTMSKLQGDGNILDAFERVDIGENEAQKADSEKPEVSPLRKYVMSFDQETLMRTASLRSKEGLSVVERQTEALFGRPEFIQGEQGGPMVAKPEPVGVTLTTLKRTVLEAVAFGSFLWDVESDIDNRYGIS